MNRAKLNSSSSSLGLPTRASWLEFTVEAIFLPFDGESAPEREFETRLHLAERLCVHAEAAEAVDAAGRPNRS